MFLFLVLTLTYCILGKQVRPLAGGAGILAS